MCVFCGQWLCVTAVNVSSGIHLEPQEFHREVQALVESPELQADTILLDCRNFSLSTASGWSCAVESVYPAFCVCEHLSLLSDTVNSLSLLFS